MKLTFWKKEEKSANEEQPKKIRSMCSAAGQALASTYTYNDIKDRLTAVIYRVLCSGVRIEFLLSGEYPGDGRPKPVAFPKPEEASVEIAGLRCIRLPSLIELKLASGMTGPGRLKDLADVQELIRILRLPASFTEELDLSVRDKFRELWTDVQEPDPVQETLPTE